MKLTLLIATVALFAGTSAFSPQNLVKQSTKLHKSTVSGDSWTGKGRFGTTNNKGVTKKVDPIKPGNRLQRKKMEDVIIDPDYYLTWSFALVGALITWYHPDNTDGSLSLIGVAGGAFHLLFASLLWVQTRRVRLIFEKDSFEFYNIKGPSLDFDKGAWLERKPDNYVSGTINRWKYDTIINWGIFPSLEFPVIIYFKETETPKEQWDKWFAAFDSYGNGQPHFFPGLANARQFKEQMELRGVTRKQIPTLKSVRQSKKD